MSTTDLQDLYMRDPNDYTVEDRRRIIEDLRAKRLANINTGKAATPPGKSSGKPSKSAGLDLDIDI